MAASRQKARRMPIRVSLVRTFCGVGGSQPVFFPVTGGEAGSDSIFLGSSGLLMAGGQGSGSRGQTALLAATVRERYAMRSLTVAASPKENHPPRQLPRTRSSVG